ncbi:hypothetical protein [uncultured Zobellia sp.]|uniref:hypothetical protein n=1 Tax=uncultured Zobellia sp. TaxID=255433 RepID=UPI002598123E|nr:hypothetical protein [uncultured Zobellia sp.]
MTNQHPDIVVNKFGAKVLLRNTSSYKVFVEEIASLELMLLFMLFAEHNDKKKVKTNLVEFYKEEEPNTISDNLEKFLKSDASDEIFKVETYELFFGQMAFCRIIDNALCYFKDILTEVVKKEPRILKSSKEKETHDFILSYESMEELLVALSDKKIKELFYGSIEDIKKFFKDRLGIELFERKEDENDFSLVIKQRNTIVHNRGRITQELADEFPVFREIVGQNLFFKYDRLSIINKLINNVIIDIDIKLRAKFGLDTFEA